MEKATSCPLAWPCATHGDREARKAGSAGSVCVCSASAGGERKERQVQHPKLDINESSPPADGQGVLEDVSISVLLSGK